MGTTTPYGLPYPEPTDRARNGSVAIRALAERVQALLVPAYATTVAADSPDQGGVTAATVGTLGGFSSSGQFTLEGGATIRYSGTRRWFMCDVELLAVAGGVALAEAKARLIHNGATVVGNAAFSGSGASGVLRITTPIRLDPFDALQLSIEGTGAAATFSDKQVRIASIGAAE